MCACPLQKATCPRSLHCFAHTARLWAVSVAHNKPATMTSLDIPAEQWAQVVEKSGGRMYLISSG